MSIFVFDRVAYAITAREYTDEGFLRVPGRVARTGIQQYLASELGLDDRSPFEIVNVYRPADEVFNLESLASYASKDVTDDHPTEMVSSDNYKALTRGVIPVAASQDGDFVIAELVVKDAEAIKKIEAGKVQLSAGYTAEYDHSPGVTDDGEAYEFVQRNIRINHVALVDKARAGAMARIFDTKNGGHQMPTFTLDNGRAIEVQDNATVALLQDSFERMKAEIKAAKDAEQEANAKADAKEEENKKLKEKASDSTFAERVAEITTTIDRAKKIAGNKFACDSVDLIEIKRAALSATSERDFSDKDAAYIAVAFDMAEEKKEEEDEEEKETKKAASDSLARLANDISQHSKAKVTAKDAYTQNLESAWKGA